MTEVATVRAAAPWHVGVVTVAHRGDDARIRNRQIRALIEHGARVTFVAPEPSGPENDSVDRILIRRTSGRRRLRAWVDAHRVARRLRGRLDIVVVHDLEAVLPVRLARPGCPVVWDVHEDIVASVPDRAWIPPLLRRPIAAVVALVERIGRRGVLLLLAETSYRERYGDWPVVPNTTWVPERVPLPGERPRVVYLGRISHGRGLGAMIELGRRLAPDVDVELVGPVDADAERELDAGVRDGAVRWSGPMPNDLALASIEGATAGLSLLDPLPNYVASMPTKIYEYLARGVPPITTPLPLAEEVVRAAGAGAVVGWDAPDELEAVVRRYVEDRTRRREEGARGHHWVSGRHDWNDDGRRFVDQLRTWSR